MNSAVHLYLSPHFDDAVYSCGALIRQQRQAGEEVLVFTVCAGEPDPNHALSDYAQSLHDRWSQLDRAAAVSAGDMVRIRRREDLDALQFLDASAVHYDELDLIYRRGSDGDWLANSDAELFSGYRATDHAACDRLADRLVDLRDHDLGAEFDRIHMYLPLALGDHVDHHLTLEAGLRFAENCSAEKVSADSVSAEKSGPPQSRPLRVFFYQDCPYAHQPTILNAGLAQRRERFDLRPLKFDISESDVLAQGNASSLYASQRSSFWESDAAMLDSMRHYLRLSDEAGAASYQMVLWELV